MIVKAIFVCLGNQSLTHLYNCISERVRLQQQKTGKSNARGVPALQLGRNFFPGPD